jgi:hypothetical protein
MSCIAGIVAGPLGNRKKANPLTSGVGQTILRTLIDCTGVRLAEGVDMKQDVLVSSLAKKPAALPKKKAASAEDTLMWRLEHLESQMQKLSELVRDHAEDVDRLVRIVAEDRNAIRQQLLRKHHEQVRVRKHLRASNSKLGLDL